MPAQEISLYWEGNKLYHQRIPKPRLLEPVAELSVGQNGDNRIIEGDNLQALVSLKNIYGGVVDAIYIDPPYNLGKNGFRYSDRRYHDPNADDSDAVYVTNEDGGKHTKWLNFIAPRLYMLRQMLSDTGVIFVSINDVELFRLGMLMNEIFGEDNWVGTIVWRSNTENNPTQIAVEHEYILCYARNKTALPSQWSSPDNDAKELMLKEFREIKSRTKSLTTLQKEYARFVKDNEDYLAGLIRYNKVDEHGPYISGRNLHNPKPGGYDYEIIHPVTKKPCKKPVTGWRYPEESMRYLIEVENRIVFGKDETQIPQIKEYLEDVEFALRSVIDIYGGIGSNNLKELFGERSVFKNAKPLDLIETLLSYATTPDSLVLDAFAGSGTTGEAVMRLNQRDGGNRRFILIEEGNGKDKFCRTLTAERIRLAIEKRGYNSGYTFYTTGRQIDRLAIVGLARDALANLICQPDETGHGKGIERVEGFQYVIGKNHRSEAICLVWYGDEKSEVTKEDLKQAAAEVKQAGLKKPFRIYGRSCRYSDAGASWKFCQIPDEILAQMHIEEDLGEDE